MPETFLSLKDLAKRYKVDPSTIWRWCKTRGLPERISLSPGCARWRLSDIEAWEASLKSAA